MLGKLIKHEFKATGRLIPAFYAFLALMCGVLFFAKKFDLTPIISTAIFFLIMAIAAVSIVTVVVIIMRFHKSVFGNEGYLTGTLPVKSGEIILSKGIIAAFWQTLSNSVALLGVYFLIDTMLGSPIDIIKNMGEGAGALVIVFLVMMAIQLFTMIAAIYFAITLANTRPFIKNNIGFSFLLYFALDMVLSVINICAMFIIPIKAVLRPTFSITFGNAIDAFLGLVVADAAMETTGSVVVPEFIGVGTVISQVIVTIALFVFASWLLKKKTSVK